MIQIIGSPVSPYVKKVLTLLIMKGVEFEVDPITPFYGDERFTRLSPLRRIPVFMDGDFVLTDSSVIAQYIEERWPDPAALPEDLQQRARVRWLDEYSNSRMGDVFIWNGFAKKIVAPMVFGAAVDDDALEDNIAQNVPKVMDYLESEAPEEGFFAGAFGLADIAIAAMFRNMKYAEWEPDAARWPKICAWLARAEAEPSLALANEWSDVLITVPPRERRALAAKIGLALTPETIADKTPRSGPMTKIG